jgi:hypothetical protein
MMEENKLIMMVGIIFNFTLISRLKMINSYPFDIDLFYPKAFRTPFILECEPNYSAEVFICGV